MTTPSARPAPGPLPFADAAWWREYLDQGEVWASTRSLTSGTFTPIDDAMPPEDRYNRARWLLTRAVPIFQLTHAGRPILATSGGEAVATGIATGITDDARASAWLRATPLYRALIVDLPARSVLELFAVVLRARHRVICPWRATRGREACGGCWAGRTPPPVLSDAELEALHLDVRLARRQACR